MTVERTYLVAGMSCDHCRAAVEEEVGAVPGVEEARADPASGRLTVRGADVDAAAVVVAVAEAGYTILP